MPTTATLLVVGVTLCSWAIVVGTFAHSERMEIHVVPLSFAF